jgi:membrane-associated protease RseP (regulator of RpoE activity)
MARTLLLPGDRPLVNLALLGATIASTFFVFFFFHSPATAGIEGPLAFSLCTVGILGAHEMGHYLLARWHRVDTSLPYFIPVPLGFGTLGAVIRIRGRIPTRNALVDIGAAGPLAGLAVALPVLWYGLTLSEVSPAPPIETGFPHPWSALRLLQSAVEWVGLWGADALPAGGPQAAIPVYGDSLLMQGMQRLVLGPIPQGHEVYVHPMVIAAWFGLLVTMLNLCPIGQLDGGHVAYALFGERAKWVGRAAALGLLFLALFFSVSWVVWLVVTTRFIGFSHPEVTDGLAPLSPGRRLVALLCLLALVGCVVPVPLQLVTVP